MSTKGEGILSAIDVALSTSKNFGSDKEIYLLQLALYEYKQGLKIIIKVARKKFSKLGY